MTSIPHEATLGGPSNGGVAARRAIVRWARRMFRREWRQQVLVVALLALAVAAAIGSITMVHNSGATADAAAEFGSANWLINYDGSDPHALEADLDAARRSFGTIDVIGHRSVPVPGGVEKVDYRAQSPDGAYGGGLLTLRRGAYPANAGQVALTDGVAELLELGIGDTLALDGRRRTVVGIVENPRRLSDEFALLSPELAGTSDRVSVLVRASEPSMDRFFDSIDNERGAFRGSSNRGNDLSGAANTLAMLSVATVFILLASLVAAAGFAVVAQRRLRQLGMLTAIGATEKHIRLVLLTNGAVVGTLAAVIGASAGFALWILFAPMLETGLDHRVDRLGLPWGLIVMTMLFAIVGASAAAWWPGRTVSRLPVTLALSGRPPQPRPARRSALAAVALIAIGIGCLALSDRDAAFLIISGLLTTIVGTLFLGPLAIRSFSAVAGRVSIAPRLALRNLARYQGRSGAALAAVTLALGIAVTVVVTASAEEARQASEPASLSDRQLRVYLGPPDVRELTPVDALGQLEQLAAGAQRIAAQLEGATLIPLAKAVESRDRVTVIDDTRVFLPMELTRRSVSPEGRTQFKLQSELYVATPAVLRYLGIDPATIDAGTDFLVDRRLAAEQFVIPSMTSRRELPVSHVQEIVVGQHLFGGESGRRPASFITLDGLRRRGWTSIPGGWLVDASAPLTGEQITDARDAAAAAGLSVEVRRKKDEPTEVMATATAAGAVLALAILAMTVGLIRGESAGETRTLTAAGATPGIRRTLTATTAGALALLGALLGVGGAYVALAAIYHDDLGYLREVPILYLVLAVVGVPLAAAGAGWLLAGREPPAIARQVIE